MKEVLKEFVQKAHDVDGQRAGDQRDQAQTAQVDRADLCVAQQAQQPQQPGLEASGTVAMRQLHAFVCRADGLHAGEQVLVLHGVTLLRPSLPDRQLQPPIPPLRPAVGPERPTDDDAQGTEGHGCHRQKNTQTVNTQSTN